MNEMDLLARLRAEVPRAAVSPRAEALFLAAVKTDAAERAVVRQPSTRTARRGLPGLGAARPAWRLAIAAGLAIALAAGITVAGLGQAGNGSSTTLTAELLADRAAAAALSTPPVQPDQWVYRKEACEGYLYNLVWETVPCPGGTVDTWSTADGTKVAYLSGGKLRVNSVAAQSRKPYLPAPPWVTLYPARASFPADPRALVSRLSSYAGGAAEDRAYQAFTIIGQWLASYLPGPVLTAELYHALADIPGVRIDRHAVATDGRHGAGFTLPLPTHTQHDLIRGWTEVIVSQRTYQFLGLKSWDSTGGSVTGTSLLRQAPVSGPGAMP